MVVVAGVTPTSATGFAVARWNTATLAAGWRAASPFPHVIIDDAFDAAELDALRAALAHEPHWSERSGLHVPQLSPPVPHFASVGALQVFPSQQPVGQDVASQTHAPPTHR